MSAARKLKRAANRGARKSASKKRTHVLKAILSHTAERAIVYRKKYIELAGKDLTREEIAACLDELREKTKTIEVLP